MKANPSPNTSPTKFKHHKAKMDMIKSSPNIKLNQTTLAKKDPNVVVCPFTDFSWG